MNSGLRFLRSREDVDPNRIAVLGHSFGGSLALLLSEQHPEVKAIMLFGAVGYSWDRSPELRARLLKAVGKIAAPILIVHAQNDYSMTPGKEIDGALNQLKKPHVLKMYPPYGKSENDGHNLIFLSVDTWEMDVFNFLDPILLQ